MTALRATLIAVITQCTDAIEAGRLDEAGSVKTGVSAVDELLPYVTASPEVPIRRAPRAFFGAIVGLIDQPRNVVCARERKETAAAAAAEMVKAASRLDAIDNGPLAALLLDMAKWVEEKGHAVQFHPGPRLEADGWVLEDNPRVLHPALLEISTRGNTGNESRAGSVRLLLSLLNPQCPSLDNKVMKLLQAIGIECTQQQVSSVRKGWKGTQLDRPGAPTG